MPDELAQEDASGRTRLFRLFQPDPVTRRLWRIVSLVFERRRGRAALALLAFCPGVLAKAGAVLAFAIIAEAVGLVPGWVAGAIVFLALAYALVATALGLARHLRAGLAGNHFGLCRMGPEADGPALTGWLHATLQGLAGKADRDPLTFLDLWGLPERAPEDDAGRRDSATRLDLDPTTVAWDGGWREQARTALARVPRRRLVNLEVMTTNLTHGRPIRLPATLQPQEDGLVEGGELLFDPVEWAHFFPECVMRHLRAVSEPLDTRRQAVVDGDGSRRTMLAFPAGADLPVLVAARMSLSFPLLISAVPLWQVDWGAGGAPHRLRRVLFSDGGIASNFPIHFFDQPLPTRPTFAINLGSQRDDAPAPRIEGPWAVADPLYESWHEIDGVESFAKAILDTLQTWRDNTQAQLRGFRERVVRVNLKAGQGGANLAMRPCVIRKVSECGEEAGRRLVTEFSGPAEEPPRPTEHWDDHRFARYRTTMSLVDDLMRSLARGWRAPADRATTPYHERVPRGRDVGPYRFPSGRRFAATEASREAYLSLVDAWDDGAPSRPYDGPVSPEFSDSDLPRPRPTLRIVPRV